MGRFILFILFIGTWFSCSEHETEKDNTEEYRKLLLSGIENTRELKFEHAHQELTALIEKAENNSILQYEILGYINLGNLYLQFSSHDEALNYFFKAQDVSEANNYDEYLNTIYNNIGIIYNSNGDYDQAVNYFKKALALSIKSGNTNREAINLINLGNSELKNENESAAQDYFSKSLDLFQEDKDTINVTVALNNLGNVYFQQGKYEQALEKYLRAVTAGKDSNELPHMGEYFLNLGKTYYQFGEYDSASHFLNKSVEVFNAMQSTENIIEAYRWQVKTFLSENKLNEALEYSIKSNKYKDSLLEEKTAKWVSQIQINYEFGKKEKEIEFIQKQAKRQNLIWIVVIFIAALIVFLSYQILRTKNLNLAQKNIILENERELNQLSLEKNEAERKQLEEQMNVQKQLNEIEQQNLRQELSFKNRELAAKALHLVNKTEVFTTLSKLMAEIDVSDKNVNRNTISEIKQVIRSNSSIDKEWNDFKRHFEAVHPGFFSSLKKNHDSLTTNDLRLCAYLLIKLNSKEIAQILNISPESVRKRKQRLRQKLEIDKDEQLEFLLNSYKDA